MPLMWKHYLNEDTAQDMFDELYRSEYKGLLRNAIALFQRMGVQGQTARDRAEDAVQETFRVAWEKRSKVLTSPSPKGWLFSTLRNKVMTLANEERIWKKHMTQITECETELIDDTSDGFRMRAELSSILTNEEYELLKRLYLDGCTYQEICDEIGMKKSTLAMRVMRLKNRFIKEYHEK